MAESFALQPLSGLTGADRLEVYPDTIQFGLARMWKRLRPRKNSCPFSQQLRSQTSVIRMSEEDAVKRTRGMPATVDSLTADLSSLGIAPGMVLLVHSSLSSLGWVSGGPVAVILALEQVLGPKGTLVMPALSGDLSDPARWKEPPVPQAW